MDNYTYTAADIQRYLAGNMPGAEMHALEKAALNDPLLADAIDGYRTADTMVTQRHLNEITAGLNAPRAAAPIIPIKKKPSTRLAAAAILLLAGISAVWWYTVKKENMPQEIAQNPTPANDAVKDSPQHTTPLAQADSLAQEPPLAKTDAPATNANLPIRMNKHGKQVPPAIPPAAAIQQDETAKTANGTEKNPADIAEKNIPSAPTARNRQAELETNAEADLSTPPPATATAKAIANNDKKRSAEKAAADIEEVVIVGYGTQKKKNITGAAKNKMNKEIIMAAAPVPNGGWAVFYKNLSDALLYKNGTLEIKVTFKDGRPQDFNVLQSPDGHSTQQAILFIKNWPGWANAATESSAVIHLQK